MADEIVEYDKEDCLYIIEELDQDIDILNKAWAEEVQSLLDSKKYKEESIEEERAIVKINDKFKDIMADILSLRDKVYSYAQFLQEQENQEAYGIEEEQEPDFSKVDENGRPLGYIRVRGKWKKIKKKQ